MTLENHHKLCLRARLCLGLGVVLGLTACAPDIHRSADAGSPAANMVLLAEQLNAKGDKEGAMDFYQRALQRDPHDVVALSEFAVLLEERGHPDGAIRCYREALRITPDDPDLLRRYGRVLLASGQPVEAKIQYEKVLQQNKGDAKALNGLGIALNALGDAEKARDSFLASLREEPKNIAALTNLAYADILAGDYTAAIARLEPYLTLPEATPALRQNLALAYGLAGREAEAERVAHLDLPVATVKANMDYYRSKRQENLAKAQVKKKDEPVASPPSLPEVQSDVVDGNLTAGVSNKDQSKGQ